jgi:hypothetical protein
MKKQLINYETLLKVTQAMSISNRPEEVVQLTVDSVKTSLEIKGCALSNRPEEVVQLTVDSVKTSLEIKGCALFLIDPQNKALEVAASCGLSAEYLKKGPLSSIRSIKKRRHRIDFGRAHLQSRKRYRFYARIFRRTMGVHPGGCKFRTGRGSNRRDPHRYVPTLSGAKRI